MIKAYKAITDADFFFMIKHNAEFHYAFLTDAQAEYLKLINYKNYVKVHHRYGPSDRAIVEAMDNYASNATMDDESAPIVQRFRSIYQGVIEYYNEQLASTLG